MFQMLPILAWFGGRMPSSFGWKALGAERPTIPPLGSCSEIFLGWCPDNQREGHFGGRNSWNHQPAGNFGIFWWESSNKSVGIVQQIVQPVVFFHVGRFPLVD
jgi:hypothetical protein